jgi:hypothetical protein
MCIDTFPLRGLHLLGFLLTSHEEFPRSTQKPEPSSYHLYAGRRPGSKQVSPELILETCKHPSFDAIPDISTSHQWFALAHLLDPYLTRSYAMPFPQRSPPGLLTTAA